MLFKLNPTQKITTILALLALGALINNFSVNLLIHLATTLIFALVLFWIFKAVTKKPKNIYNSIISALIIFLILNYGIAGNSAIVYSLIATFVAIFSKFFIEPKGLPIFNPVILGLLTTFGISKIPGMEPVLISWWGTNYQIHFDFGGETIYHFRLAMAILAVWILFWFKNWHKWGIFLSFLVTHAILSFALQQDLTLLKFIFTDGTIYFFAAIMLVDPKSSPIHGKQQIIYGILAALAYNGLNYFALPHYDLFAIATANIYFFLTKSLKKPQSDKA